MDKEFNLSDYSPATLAYLGDAVYELYARKRVVGNGNVKASRLSELAKTFVTAGSQSKAVDIILPLLNDEEIAVYKAGRNSHSVKSPKRVAVADYRRATGLECLFGFLSLAGKKERADFLFDTIALEFERHKDAEKND